MMSVNFKNTHILSINGADYYYTINGVSKSDALDSIKNVGLTKNKGVS